MTSPNVNIIVTDVGPEGYNSIFVSKMDVA